MKDKHAKMTDVTHSRTIYPIELLTGVRSKFLGGGEGVVDGEGGSGEGCLKLGGGGGGSLRDLSKNI